MTKLIKYIFPNTAYGTFSSSGLDKTTEMLKASNDRSKNFNGKNSTHHECKFCPRVGKIMNYWKIQIIEFPQFPLSRV